MGGMPMYCRVNSTASWLSSGHLTEGGGSPRRVGKDSQDAHGVLSYIQVGHMVLIWVIVTALGSVGQFETLTEDNILETEQMARFHFELGNGEKVVIEAEAVDNVPEFVRELKEHGYVTGRKEGGEVVALIDPHVAVVRLMRAN